MRTWWSRVKQRQIPVTHLTCLQDVGVLGVDPLYGEGQVGWGQEGANSPEVLEEAGVSCTSDLLVLGTYILRDRHTATDVWRFIINYQQLFFKSCKEVKQSFVVSWWYFWKLHHLWEIREWHWGNWEILFSLNVWSLVQNSLNINIWFSFEVLTFSRKLQRLCFQVNFSSLDHDK